MYIGRIKMTTEDDIKVIQEEVKEMKDYPVKLSWRNVWIVVTTSVTIIGGAFGIGMKLQYEGDKILQLKQERELQKQISSKEDELIEMKRKLKESSEDNIYLSNKVTKIKDLYDKCVEGNPWVFKSDGDNK
jgi:hypothetical protein